LPRNPTPGPAGHAFLYGHVWVTLAVLVWHSQYGIWAFLLLSRFFIPKGQISKVPADGDVRFAPRWKWRGSCSSWLPPGRRNWENTLFCSPKTSPGIMRVRKGFRSKRRTLNDTRTTQAVQSGADYPEASRCGGHVGGRQDDWGGVPGVGN